MYTKRFLNNDLLTQIHGSFFGIPFLSSGLGTLATKDFSDPAKFLEMYGGYLINHNEYQFAFKLLSSIPYGSLVRSKDLLFYAAIVYSQCGYYFEANSFISLSLSKFTERDEQQSALLEITKARVSFCMGFSSVEDFSATLDNIIKRLEDEQNIAIVKVQNLQLKLLLAIKQYGYIKTYINPIINEIKKFLENIEVSKFSKEAKLLLKLNCANYLGEAANFQFVHDAMQYRIQEKLQMPSSVQERINKVKDTFELVQQSYQIAAAIISESEKEKLETTKAQALIIITNNFFQFSFNSYLLKLESDDVQKNETKLQFLKNMENIILSAHLFQKNNLLEDTHNALCLASDTNRLYILMFGEKLTNYDELKYMKIIAEIEKSTGITRKLSMLDIVKPFSSEETIAPEDNCSEMSDEEIDRYSLMLLETMGIPSNRLKNVKKDLIEQRKFYNKRHCKNLILLQNLEHTKSKDTLYNLPPIFLFDCLVKKWRTEDNPEIENLLEKLNNGVCKNCKYIIPNNN